MSAAEPGIDDAGEPELPQLPAGDGLISAQPRHAQFISAQPSQAGTSSDLPTFSSDDLAPSAENYAIKRRKHRRVGPWWQLPQSQDYPRKKRRMQRNFDSGIFMGSENSFASSDIPSSELDRLSTHGLDATENMVRADSDDLSPGQHRPVLSNVASILPEPQQPPRKAEDHDGDDREKKTRGEGVISSTGYNARRQQYLEDIDAALEHWRNGIDLKGKLTWHIDEPNEPAMAGLFQPLHHLVHTRAFDDPERYEHLIPDIRLFLDDNLLQAIPPEVYSLKNLTHLSMRGNLLQTIDPCIANCTRLKHLDLWNNRIQWLPAEILLLVDLKEIYIFDSHFVQPVYLDANGALHSYKPEEGSVLGETCIMSQISYLDSGGTAIRKSAPKPSGVSSHGPSRRPFDPPEPTSSRVRSLLELCAAAAAKYVPKNQRDAVAENFPHLVKLLNAGYQSQDSSYTPICPCGRKFVQSRAEWFEWHRCANVLAPFLWKACSWRCAQERRETIRLRHAEWDDRLVNLGWEQSKSP